MAKPKLIEKPVRMSIVVSEAQAKAITIAASRQSITEGKKISDLEMIRRALRESFPFNEQMDLF